MQIEREDLAWAAGFFEGEGYVGLHLRHDPNAVSLAAKQQVYATLVFEVGQVNPEPILRLSLIFAPLGYVSKPYKNSKSSTSSIRFRANTFEHVQAFVAMLWYWLSAKKREQAANALKGYLLADAARPRLKSGPGSGPRPYRRKAV